MVEWIQQHIVLILVVVGGLLVGVVFLKKQPASTPGANGAGATADLSGLATDANGRPIVYRDVADTFINVNKTSTVNSTVNNPAMPVPSAPPTTPTTPASPIEHPIEEAFIRSRFNSALTNHYDTGQPKGIPIRKTPGGAISGYAAYGSDVALKNTQDYNGPSNLGGSTGSTKWFMTSSGGYISAYDVTSLT